jgi:hypothetical protein
MTKSDFNLIIIESFAHDHRHYFFKSMQKLKHRELGYSKKGFLAGIDESFRWLNTEVRKVDPLCCQVSLPDGSSREETLSPVPGVLKKQLAGLHNEGCITYPFRKNIEVRCQTDGRFVMMITAESMASLWPDVHAFLKPYHDVNEPAPVPPVLKGDEPGIFWDNIIRIPGSIAAKFRPLEDERKDGKSGSPAREPSEALIDSNGKVFLKDVALKHAWENKQITHQNMHEIAALYGFKSGTKLYRDYIEVMKRADRIADPDGSTRAMKYKIRLFERASEIVSPEYKYKALEEIDILRSILKKVYLHR